MYKYVYLTSAEPQNSSRSRSTLAPTSCNDVYLMSEFHIGLRREWIPKVLYAAMSGANHVYLMSEFHIRHILPQVLYAAMSGARGECGRDLMGEREKER
jgi:hypothetical protein